MHDHNQAIGALAAHLIENHSQLDGAVSAGAFLATFLHGHKLVGATELQQQQLFGAALYVVITSKPELFTAYREEADRMFAAAEAKLNDKQGATVQ